MVMNFPILPSQDERVVAEAWRSGDEDALVAILDGLKDRPSSSKVKSDVAGILRTTKSRRVRNAAALTLADLGAKDMISQIIDVLRDPNVAEEAGTLLFALDELEASLPLDVIPGLIAKGSYEARAETLIFVKEGRVEPCDDEQENGAKLTLAMIASGEDSEAAEAAGLALTYLADRSDGGRSS